MKDVFQKIPLQSLGAIKSCTEAFIFISWMNPNCLKGNVAKTFDLNSYSC